METKPQMRMMRLFCEAAVQLVGPCLFTRFSRTCTHPRQILTPTQYPNPQGCKRLRLPGIGCGTYTKKLPKARRQILELVFLGAIGVCEAKYSDLKISKRFPYDPDNPNTDLFQEV